MTRTLSLLLTLLALPTLVQAQARGTIRGAVTDSADGAGVVGAAVTLAGTGRGTLTGNNGVYFFRELAPGTYTVRVQHVAFQPAERTVSVAAGETVTLPFALVPQVIELAELVAVGYGERRRFEVTSAIASVDEEDIRNVPVASVDAALQGKAAGVQVVQNAGNPGNAMTVRVRGSSSISASNQPLYVVDGVPILREDFSQLGMGGQEISAITGLSPDDIASIDILKDASAAAIYGSRGSNGVVLITTKRGREGAPRLTFNAYTGWQEAERRLDLLNASEYLEFMNESAENDGLGPNFYGVPGVSDVLNTDWQEAVLRPAPVNNVSAALSGGGERVRYYVTGSWFDQEGVVLGSEYTRAAGRVNLDFSPTDRLDLKTSVSYAREDNDRVQGDGSLYGVVTYALAESPLIGVRRNTGAFTGPSDGLVYYNAVALAVLNPTEALSQRTLANIEATYRLTDRLRITGRVGYDALTVRELQWQSPFVEGTYPASAGGVSKSGFTGATRYLAESFADWSPLVGRQQLTLTGGAGVELNDWELNFIRGEGFADAAVHQIRNATVITDQDGTLGEHNLVSTFARAHWSMLDRYFLDASIRSDGSSRFAPNVRWGVFPAVSGGWLVSAEPFMAARPALLSTLRLRGSWGETGNEAIGDYAYQGLFGSANYGDTPGIAPASLSNLGLQWETTTELNAGLDAGPFGDRVVVQFDVYSKETRDLLLNRPISSTSGFGSLFANVGAMENRGFEVGLNATLFDAGTPGGLRWAAEFNVARNHNEVTELFNDEPFNTGERGVNRVEVGQPLGAFHVLRFQGVDPQTGDAIFEDADTTDWFIDPTSGDTTRITAADRQIVGSPHPDWFGGLKNTLWFGAFDLSVFVSFSQGAEIFNGIRLFADDGGYYLDNKFADVLRRWQQPGDVTDVPRASYDGLSGADVISSRYIEDASYIRIQDITLGFRIPAAIAGRMGMSNARLFASVKNLHTFTDYTGYSPDVNSNGASANASLGTDFYAYPLARTFTLGITATP